MEILSCIWFKICWKETNVKTLTIYFLKVDSQNNKMRVKNRLIHFPEIPERPNKTQIQGL